MVNHTVEVRNGLKFQFSVPSTPEEYGEVSKRGPGALLEDAIANNVYRTGLPDVWDMLAKDLFETHKIEKKQKPHPNKERAEKGETVDNETDIAYVDRVMAEKNLKLEDVQSIVNGFGIVPLDLTSRKGTGGTSLVGKGDLTMADTYLDAGEEKCKTALAKIAQFTKQPQVELTGDRAKDRLAVALAIKAYRAAQAGLDAVLSS